MQWIDGGPGVSAGPLVRGWGWIVMSAHCPWSPVVTSPRHKLVTDHLVTRVRCHGWGSASHRMFIFVVGLTELTRLSLRWFIVIAQGVVQTSGHHHPATHIVYDLFTLSVQIFIFSQFAPIAITAWGRVMWTAISELLCCYWSGPGRETTQHPPINWSQTRAERSWKEWENGTNQTSMPVQLSILRF